MHCIVQRFLMCVTCAISGNAHLSLTVQFVLKLWDIIEECSISSQFHFMRVYSLKLHNGMVCLPPAGDLENLEKELRRSQINPFVFENKIHVLRGYLSCQEE